MAQQLILLGTQGSQSGDTVRSAFDYSNQNFTELYGWLDQGVKTTSSPTFAGLTNSGTSYFNNTSYYGSSTAGIITWGGTPSGFSVKALAGKVLRLGANNDTHITIGTDGQTTLNDINVEATAPTLQFHESDQSLINGYRRFRMNGSNFSFERNTSSVAAWNSYVSDLKIDNTGLVTAKDIKIYGSGHGGAIFQETDEYDGSIEIIPIIDQYTISANKLYFAGAQEDQWRIAGGGLGITGNSNINGGLSIGTSTSVRKLYVYGGDDYNTVFCSASFRSGYALRKPGTTTTMGSCLLLEDDETYRFGTAAAYHIIMYQDKNTIICGNGSEVMRITTGRVGIMASSPLSDAALDVGGSTKVNASIYPRVAITSNASRIEALQLQNLSPSTTAEMRFITAADDDTYLAFTQPSSTNTGTFFGKTKSSGSFVFSNSRPLYIGTITAQELGLGTSNITRATIDSSGNFKTISGDIQTGGTFKSSDGSPGINISLCMDTVDGQVHDIVITDGLITQWDIE